MIRVGVIGCGQWGQNYLRNFGELAERACVVAYADADVSRLSGIRARFPNARPSSDADGVLSDSEVEAVVVSTPSWTHAKIVSAALDAGKHVLVEKPFVLDVNDGQKLVEKAQKNGLVLLVGHVYEYNPAIQHIRQLIGTRALGDVYYVQSTRTNLGPIREDVNALWDLGPHDVSILLHLMGTMPTQVRATGASFFGNGRHDVVFGTMEFPGKALGHFWLSWLDPRKVREITVVASSRMVVFDDLNPQEPLRIYDRGLSEVPRYQTFGEFQLVPRFGDITVPRVPAAEPLRLQCEHFLDCVAGKSIPLTDGNNGLRVVRVLSAMQRSLDNGGSSVAVS